MKIICQICKLPLNSTLSDEVEASKDVVSLLKSHIRFKHKTNQASYEDHLAEILESAKILPSYLFLSYFVDLENPETSDRIGVMMDELGKGLEPIEDLFVDEEEEEIEEEEIEKNELEKEETAKV